MSETFGTQVQRPEEDATLVVPGGPYGIRVTVTPIGDDEAAVDVYTWLGRKVEVTAPVARYLLERNARLRFGSLGVDPDGDVILEASLFPEQVDPVALSRLVELIAVAADEIDEELRTRFG